MVMRVFFGCCVVFMALIASHVLHAGTATQKVSSRKLLALERQRAKAASDNHEREMREAQERIERIHAQREATVFRQYEELKKQFAKSQEEIAKLQAETKAGRAKKWFEAIKNGNVQVLQRMVDDGDDSYIESKIEYQDAACVVGDTSLICAVRAKQEDVVRWLLSKNAQVNGMSTRGAAPLHWAVNNNLIAITELLLLAGANPDLRALGNAPHDAASVVFAALRGSPAMITLLHRAKASFSDHGGYNCLYQAAHAGRVENVKRLLELGAPLPTGQSFKETNQFVRSANDTYLLALWHASIKGKQEIFLAQREHAIFLATKATFKFPEPIIHNILSMAVRPNLSIEPTSRIDAIKSSLKILNRLGSRSK
jgi:ankyrin repeat protein